MNKYIALLFLFLSGCSTEESDGNYSENAEFRVQEALYFSAHFPHSLGNFKELIDTPFYLSDGNVLQSRAELYEYFDDISKMMEEVGGNEKLKMTENISFKSFSPDYFLSRRLELGEQTKKFIQNSLGEGGAVVQVFYSEKHMSYFFVKSNAHNSLSIVGEIN